LKNFKLDKKSSRKKVRPLRRKLWRTHKRRPRNKLPNFKVKHHFKAKDQLVDVAVVAAIEEMKEAVDLVEEAAVVAEKKPKKIKAALTLKTKSSITPMMISITRLLPALPQGTR